jgi:hypothetical protein
MEQKISPAITPEAARASLAEIDSVNQSIRHAIAAGISAPLLILWGAIWIICFTTEQFLPHWSQKVWFGLTGLGMVVSLLSGLFLHSPVKINGSSPLLSRMGIAWLILFAYAALWVWFLGPWEIPHRGYDQLFDRKSGAYICTVCMFAYVLMGLWLDRFLLVLGASVTVLTFVGYQYVPNYFYIWMAVTGGGSLMFTGLFIRKFWR